MIPPQEEEYIVNLKEMSPRIDLQIRRIQSCEAAIFYHKRLQQLASAAEQKVLSLKNGNEIVVETTTLV